MKVTSFSSQEIFPTQEVQESLFPTLTNHQGWEITLRGDCFSLKNSLGIKYDDIDSCIIETDQMSDERVKEKFTNAFPREVHVETHKGQTYVRFGPYGLPGGAPGDEDSSDWGTTLARGTVYTGLAATGVYGVYKLGTGENLKERVKGAAALGASISGITSLRKGDSALQCAGKTALGAGLGAGASVASSYLPQHLGGDLKAQVYAQALVGGASGAVDTVGRTLIDEQRLPSMKEVGKGAACGAASAGVGTLVSAGAHACIPTNAAEGAFGASSRMTKAFLVNAAGAGAGTVAANGSRGFIEGEELSRKRLFNGAFESALTSGTIGAAVSGVEEYHRYQDYQNILDKKAKLEEAKNEVIEKKAELDQANQECETLQQEVEQLEQELGPLLEIEVEVARINEEVAQLEKDLAQLEREINGEVENATRSRDEAMEKYKESEAKKDALTIERDQRLEERNRLQNQNNEELASKQERLEQARRNLESKKAARIKAEQVYQTAKSVNEGVEDVLKWMKISDLRRDEERYLKRAEHEKRKILKNINDLLAKGYKAKIGGKYYRSAKEILNKVLERKFPVWKKGQNRVSNSRIDWSKQELGKSTPIDRVKTYRDYMKKAESAGAEINALKKPQNEKERLFQEKEVKREQELKLCAERATREEEFAAAELDAAQKAASQPVDAALVQQAEEALRQTEEALQSATDEFSEKADEACDAINKKGRIVQETQERMKQEEVSTQREIEEKRGTVPGLEKELEQKPIVEQQLKEKKGGVTEFETSTIPKAQAGLEAAKGNRAGRASSYQEKVEAHAAKYSDVPDFRYLSLNSLLGPSKEAEE